MEVYQPSMFDQLDPVLEKLNSQLESYITFYQKCHENRENGTKEYYIETLDGESEMIETTMENEILEVRQ